MHRSPSQHLALKSRNEMINCRSNNCKYEQNVNFASLQHISLGIVDLLHQVEDLRDLFTNETRLSNNAANNSSSVKSQESEGYMNKNK